MDMENEQCGCCGNGPRIWNSQYCLKCYNAHTTRLWRARAIAREGSHRRYAALVEWCEANSIREGAKKYKKGLK